MIKCIGLLAVILSFIGGSCLAQISPSDKQSLNTLASTIGAQAAKFGACGINTSALQSFLTQVEVASHATEDDKIEADGNYMRSLSSAQASLNASGQSCALTRQQAQQDFDALMQTLRARLASSQADTSGNQTPNPPRPVYNQTDGTTRTQAGMAKFADTCPHDDTYYTVRFGASGTVFSFMLKNNHVAHLSLSQNSTYVRGCGSWSNSTNYQYIDLESR